jgi:hypothetical protein
MSLNMPLSPKLQLYNELVKFVTIKLNLTYKEGLKYSSKLFEKITDKYPNLSFEERIDIATKEIQNDNKNKLFEIEI